MEPTATPAGANQSRGPAPQQPEARSLSPATELILVLLLTAIAAVRLYKLGVWSFWVDEMFTLRDSLDRSALFHNLTYPLSYMLIGAALKTWGVSEWSARIVPCAFGIITPAVIYLLARREFGKGPALIAAGLLAISPWSLYWSQMARFYTMTMLFSAAAALLFFSGYEHRSPARMATAAAIMILAALSHYSAFLVLASLVVYTVALYVLKWPRPNWAALRSGFRTLLSFYLPFVLAAVIMAPKVVLILRSYADTYATTGTTFSVPLKGAAYVVFSTLYRVELVIAAAAALTGLFLLRRKDRRGLFLASLVVVPIVLLAIAGAFSRGENRYALVTLPAFALLAGIGAAEVYRSLRPRSAALAIILPLVLALPCIQRSATYFSALSNGDRWNYRAAAAVIRRNVRPGELVLAPMRTPVDYYLKGSGARALDLEPAELGRYASLGKRMWFVVEDSTRGESAGLAAAGWLRRHCVLVANFPASSPVANYGVSVYFYAPGLPPQPRR